MIPEFLRRELERQPMLQKILQNTGWLLAEKTLRLGLGLLVGGWTARYLGPEQFGLLNYALAIVALFGILANLGIDRVVVREIVREPASRDAILGAAFVLKLAGGAIAVVASVGAGLLLSAGDDGLAPLVTVMAFTLIAQSFDTVDLWFQSQLNARLAVLARNIAFVTLAAAKILLILLHAPLIAFAWAVLGESMLAAGALLAAYRLNRNRITAWRGDGGRMRDLLAQCWPLMISGLLVAIYMRIDQVMLGQMAGAEAVGIYSAGIVLSEAWYAIPIAVVASAAPLLAQARETDHDAYVRRMTLLVRWLAIFSCAVALPVSLLSEPLTVLVFGDKYRASASILAIHVWAVLFVALGLVSGQYLVIENQNRIVLQRTLLGAALNILLNLAWIPQYGALGSAWATLISYAAATLFLFQNAVSRACLRMMLGALWPVAGTRR